MTPARPSADRLPATIREGLERLAADAVGPFGRTPLSRLVADHLPVFSKLLEMRASWAQQAGLLADSGIVGADGPVSAAVLRATYARAAAAAARGTTNRNLTDTNEADRSKTKCDATKRSRAKPIDTRQAKSSLGESQQRETLGGRTGRAPPELNGTKTKAAHAAQIRGPDQPAATADGLARRAALINKPMHTR